MNEPMHELSLEVALCVRRKRESVTLLPRWQNSRTQAPIQIIAIMSTSSTNRSQLCLPANQPPRPYAANRRHTNKTIYSMHVTSHLDFPFMICVGILALMPQTQRKQPFMRCLASFASFSFFSFLTLFVVVVVSPSLYSISLSSSMKLYNGNNASECVSVRYFRCRCFVQLFVALWCCCCFYFLKDVAAANLLCRKNDTQHSYAQSVVIIVSDSRWCCCALQQGVWLRDRIQLRRNGAVFVSLIQQKDHLTAGRTYGKPEPLSFFLIFYFTSSHAAHVNAEIHAVVVYFRIDRVRWLNNARRAGAECERGVRHCSTSATARIWPGYKLIVIVSEY